EHRRMFLEGPRRVAEALGLHQMRDQPAVVLFDELHKYERWKDFLKGFFDTYADRARIIVSGSARLDVFNQAGDSLTGRYFSYRMHPFSVGEWSRYVEPGVVCNTRWEALRSFGGFPEPLLKGDERFYRRWRTSRTQQLLRDELRDLSRIHDIARIEVLHTLLRERVGQLTSYSSLAGQLRVSVDTVRRWLSTLAGLYQVFAVRPYWRNVPRSLRKEPKYYFWDWSIVSPGGARNENLIASHLLKAAHLWTDLGHGDFELFFLRDKERREVDLLMTRDQEPWLLVETKTARRGHLSGHLEYFAKRLRVPIVLQVAMDLPPVAGTCLTEGPPLIVPARTLLAELP
ncbi:ATP-binding protein, partial [Myxococcota bacterium]